MCYSQSCRYIIQDLRRPFRIGVALQMIKTSGNYMIRYELSYAYRISYKWRLFELNDP